PERGGKRSREDAGSDESRPKKSREPPRPAGPIPEPMPEDPENRERILEKLMDQDEVDPEGEPVDEGTVKKMILTFEKRSYKNQELRIKFPDNPE
ncbi:beta-catenin-like protein 1, partial [Clarias magur]